MSNSMSKQESHSESYEHPIVEADHFASMRQSVNPFHKLRFHHRKYRDQTHFVLVFLFLYPMQLMFDPILQYKLDSDIPIEY